MKEYRIIYLLCLVTEHLAPLMPGFTQLRSDGPGLDTIPGNMILINTSTL